MQDRSLTIFANPGKAAIVGAEELAAGIRKDLVRFERFPGIGHNVLSECPRAMETSLEFVAG